MKSRTFRYQPWLVFALVLLCAAGIEAGQGARAGKAAKESPDTQEGRKDIFLSEDVPNPDGPVMVYETVIEVEINKKGMATVRETIDTVSQGFTNKSYPDTFSYLYFFRRGVPFKVLEVKRNGKPAPSSGRLGERRIFATLGSESFINWNQRWNPPEPRNHYVYEILYRTGLDIHFGKDRDIFSWDINNEEYIKKARVVFRVPGNPAMELLRTAVPEYDVLSFREWMLDDNGRLRTRTTSEGFEVSTTGEILSGERIVFWVALPKGFIEEPSAQKQWLYFKHDNRGVIYSVIGLAVLCIYYAFIWFFYGRDPRQGILMPIYDPPAGLSPAAMRFVSTLRFDAKCFAAALISITVKGHMTIERTGKSTVLRACHDAREDLSADESVVHSGLFSKGNEVDLGSDKGVIVNRAARNLANHLMKNFQKTYLITNFRFFALGMVITLIFLVLSGWWLSQDREMGGYFLFVSFVASIFSVPVFFFFQYVLRLWWEFSQASARGKLRIALENAILLFIFPFIAMYVAFLSQIVSMTSPSVLLFILLALLINVFFTSLLNAPTKECRALRDQIEGFRMFLEATAKDRLNMLNPPEKTPELFTRDLPYALALGIGQKWAEGVAGVVAADIEWLNMNDDFWNKLAAGDPDELFKFLKTSLQEDRATVA